MNAFEMENAVSATEREPTGYLATSEFILVYVLNLFVESIRDYLNRRVARRVLLEKEQSQRTFVVVKAAGTSRLGFAVATNSIIRVGSALLFTSRLSKNIVNLVLCLNRQRQIYVFSRLYAVLYQIAGR